jgi:hypothetical protein
MLCHALLLVSVFAVDGLAYKKIKVFMPQTPPLDLSGQTRLAVLDFHGRNRAEDAAGRMLADEMIRLMLLEDRGIHPVSGGFFRSMKDGRTMIEGVSTRCFDLIERSRLESVLDELSLSQSNLMSDADAARVGQLLGVDLIISGELTSSFDRKKVTESRSKRKDGKRISYTVTCTNRIATVTANIRLVNAVTGQILATDRTKRSISDKICPGSTSPRQPDEMISACAVQVANDLVNMINPWYALEVHELEKIKSNPIKQQAEQAADFAENLQFDRAWKIYAELYDNDPYNPKLAYNLGMIFELAGDFDEAADMYQVAASLKDDKKYHRALERIDRRDNLVYFLESVGQELIPYALDEERPTEAPAWTVTVRGKAEQRIAVLAQRSRDAKPVAQVPGDIQLAVLAKEGDWYLVQLLGGKQGYLHQSQVKR